MGIYLVQPKGDHFRIIYNHRDQAKIKNKDKTLKVNKEFIKFGKSENLDQRHKEYQEIFGEDVIFKKIKYFIEKTKMEFFEKDLRDKFIKYRVKSPNRGRLLEWMNGINIKDAEKIINK